MLLPKETLNQISYFEYTTEVPSYMKPYDVFTIHFKQWWKFRKVIKIKRVIETINKDESYTHTISPGARMLNQQLIEYAESTFQTDELKVVDNIDNIIKLGTPDDPAP